MDKQIIIEEIDNGWIVTLTSKPSCRINKIFAENRDKLLKLINNFLFFNDKEKK